MRFIAALSVGLCSLGAGTALAGDCSPHCDYYHDYGPYNFSYVEPGLTGYPVCYRQGNCSRLSGRSAFRPSARPGYDPAGDTAEDDTIAT